MFKRRTLLTVITLVLTVFCSHASLWGAEPKPGDIIDSTNIDQFTDYLPGHMARFVKDGWGMEKPVVIHVRKSEPWNNSKPYLEASIQNAAKVKLTNDGLLEGYDGVGLPFPDPKEPGLALKVMWNRNFKEEVDSAAVPNSYKSFQRRKNGRITHVNNVLYMLKFSGRTNMEPTPNLPNSRGIRRAMMVFSKTPPYKDLTMLTWRYDDFLKDDELWAYVPTLRRSLRMMATERSNPISGSIKTWDSMMCFDGIITRFNYELLREQKILSLLHANKTADDLPGGVLTHPIVYGPDEPFELIDTFVISITSKDPRYPTSKWDIWVHNTFYDALYGEMYDKSGEFWKSTYQSFKLFDFPGGTYFPFGIIFGIYDYKTQNWGTQVVGDFEINVPLDQAMFDPGTLGRYGQ